MPPAVKRTTGSLPRPGDLLDQLVRGLELLGGDVELVLGRLVSRRISPRIWRMWVVALETSPVPGLALGADHRRALGDPAQRLAEVGRAADERTSNGPLVDVVRVVGRG
jgi:hypothetical protein